jgi:SAF domain
VVAAATDSDLVWQARTELAAGTPVGEQDLRAIEVRLPSGATGAYLAASGPKPVGWVLTRPVGEHELLPRGALAAPDAAGVDWRVVTVPVLRFHYPGDLAKGQQVDVYMTAGGGSVAAPPPTQPVLVLRAATVAHVDTSSIGGLSGAGSGIGVELAVPAADATALVRAAQAGAIDLVRVPTSTAGTR